MSIADHIMHASKVGGDHTAIDFDGAVLSWAALSGGITALDVLLTRAGLSQDCLVGLLGRNRLEQVGGFIAILGSGRGILLVNAIRPVQHIADEILDLKLACLMGSREDLPSQIVGAAVQTGTLVVGISVVDSKLQYDTLEPLRSSKFRVRVPGTLIEIQTSGTTGTPKRVAVLERTVEASLCDGVRTAAGTVAREARAVKSSPTLMFTPLVHTSGTFNTLMSVFEVRPIVLFEKFDPDKYRQALVRYRPKFAPLPPTALKMLLDSTATREEFSSVIAVRAGTAPLSVELQTAFESKFGVPVLTTYGATEFMGVVTSWTLEDYRQFGAAKRNSVGRASKGVQIRIVAPETGTELPVGDSGILEAKLDRIDGAKDWIRTSDLAKIDADGFLYILGRTDDAIIRGGFKVMAGKVADVLRQYPGVCEVIVVGRLDERLGEVPVAVVEPYPEARLVNPAELRAFAKQHLSSYEVPAHIHIIERLPRTVSDKISRPEVHRILDRLAT